MNTKSRRAKKTGVLAQWYNRRDLGMIAERAGHEELFSREIVKILCEGFETLLPLYRFLHTLADG